MLSKRNFLEHEIPYKQLEQLGISKKSILAANKDITKIFMTGGFTPLLQMQVKGDEQTFSFLGKVRMTREPKGGVTLDILTKKKKTAVDKDLKIDSTEMEHLRHGMILKKNVYADNKKTTYYAQLDGETNAILKVKARDVAIPGVVKDVDIDKQMREKIREGIPVEIDADGTTYTIGIDLLNPAGFRIIQGNEEDWNAMIAKEWDRLNPDEIGFWLTDENGWQYQEIAESKIRDLKMDYNTISEDSITIRLQKNQSASITL